MSRPPAASPHPAHPPRCDWGLAGTCCCCASGGPGGSCQGSGAAPQAEGTGRARLSCPRPGLPDGVCVDEREQRPEGEALPQLGASRLPSVGSAFSSVTWGGPPPAQRVRSAKVTVGGDAGTCVLGMALPRPCPWGTVSTPPHTHTRPARPSALTVPFPLLQGRLVQTRKSGCFPSTSVKPCPVDGRVSGVGAPAWAGAVLAGAALLMAVSWPRSTLHPEKMGGPGQGALLFEGPGQWGLHSIMGVRNPEKARHQEMPQHPPGPWRPCPARSVCAASLPRGRRAQGDAWGLGPALLASQGTTRQRRTCR